MTAAPPGPSAPATSPVRANVVSVVFCPEPPLLLPEVEGRPSPETTELRAACGRAVAALVATAPAAVVVVGGGGAPGVRFGTGDAADLGGWGVRAVVPFAGPPGPSAPRLPPAHAIGARLLDEAGYGNTRVGVGPEDLADLLDELPGPLGLLVMGDGSARRTPKAPGSFDDRAASLDAEVCAALGAGDAAALVALDLAVGERLLAAGTATWRAVGAALLGAGFTGTVHYDDAPFGVGYLVADWAVAS